MIHHNNILIAQKVTRLNRCMRVRIVVIEVDPFLMMGFPHFLINYNKQIQNQSFYIRFCKGTVAKSPVFPKK